MTAQVTSRRAFRRTDDYAPGVPKVKLATEDLPLPLHPTRRGGVVSQVGYLGGSKAEHLKDFVSTIIDRRLNVRGINVGSKDDQDDLVAAISATQMTFEDIIDSVWPFEKSDEAIQYVWQGNQVGKVVIKLEPGYKTA